MEDNRFSCINTDPKFRRIPKTARKVKVDKRFQSMFNEKKFNIKQKIDKRGRRVSYKSTENLKRYYELCPEDNPKEAHEEPSISKKRKKKEIEVDVDDNQSESDSETESCEDSLNIKHKSDKTLSKDIKDKLQDLTVNYARGESRLLSESSSDDDDDDDGEESEEYSETDDIDHKWGELDKDAETTEEATYRLAACNMDWDRIRAVDLMVLFNSFLPQGGIVKSVAIYPSEFGKKRLLEEEIKGPIELVDKDNDKEADEQEEGAKYHMEKLRQYQLNRLKYYYAIITFDSANVANKVYTECDGMEYESSATKLDLRFVPDDMAFEDEAREVCEKLPEVNKYQPRFFTTTALQQAKVDLTWDETDVNRIETIQKFNSGKANDVSEQDLQHFLASSSGSESDNEIEINTNSNEENPADDSIAKYKLLLQEIESKEKERKSEDIEMEETWDLNIKEKTEELVKQKLDNDEEKTPFQKYLDKRKEKRKEKKRNKINETINNEDSDIPSDIDMNDPYFAEEFSKEPKTKKSKKVSNIDEEEDDEKGNGELELLLMNEGSKKHFSLKKIQKEESNTNSSKKRKRDKLIAEENDKDNFEVNAADERFSALYTSHLYNIDPTDPLYKKTKGMETLIGEKMKRKTDKVETVETKNQKDKSKNKINAELSVLMKSVKGKTKALQHNNKKRL